MLIPKIDYIATTSVYSFKADKDPHSKKIIEEIIILPVF